MTRLWRWRRDRADIEANRGTAFLDLDRFEDALACFERVFASNPVDVGVLINRGNALDQAQTAPAEGLRPAMTPLLRLIPIMPWRLPPAVFLLPSWVDLRTRWQATSARFAST